MDRIDVFDYIERAAAVLDANLVGFTHAAEKLTEYLERTFGDFDATIGVTSRIKTRDSLKEKIVRNSLYKDAPADRIVFEIHDIIGVKIECRFFKDEALLYRKICETFCVDVGDGFFSPADKKAIRLKLDAPQPEKQKNGFSIYRVDGNVAYAGENYNFELQIKSLVNSFWSEIEHKLIYKNNKLNQADSLIKEMLGSTHVSLVGIDHQLSLIFDRVSSSALNTQHEQFKSILVLGLNEMYTAIVKANTGIAASISEYSEAIVEYLLTASSYTKYLHGDSFIKTMSESMMRAIAPNDAETAERISKLADGDNYGGLIINLMDWMRNIDYATVAIGEKITDIDVKLDGVSAEIGKIFLRGINDDFYLNTFFHIFFSLERGNDSEDFADYVTYYYNRVMSGKTQDKIYRTLAIMAETPAHKLPLESTIKMLADIN